MATEEFIKLSAEDSKRASEILASGDELEELGLIIARTMKIGGGSPIITKIKTTREYGTHIEGPRVPRERNRIIVHRCCAEYDDGTCGCFVEPPGMCTQC